MQFWWLSSHKMTFSVGVNDSNIIVDPAPIIKKFKGQPLNNLIGWMKKQGGFRSEKMLKLIRVGIVGSRSRNSERDKNILTRVLCRYMDKDCRIHVVSGGCYKGADKFAEELAEEYMLGTSIHKPDTFEGMKRWEYARACYERNTLIAEECDLLLALWDGVSSGTKDTIDKVKKLEKPVVIL